MRNLIISLCFALPLVGCSTDKAPVVEDFSDLASLDEKSDAFSYRMKLLGSLDYGSTSADLKYTSSPRFRAYKFAGHKGDAVDAWVRSSNGGDAVAWIVDNKFNVVTSNDDAPEGGTLDAHLVATLPGNTDPAIVTYYIIYRDYDLHQKKFSVRLDGKPDYFSCESDADCVAVPAHVCCPNCRLAAVNATQTEAYANEPLICAAVICPKIACFLDTRVAQCNAAKRCEMVAVEDIACGGFIATAHQCPEGYICQHSPPGGDLPGQCVAAPAGDQHCGGFAGLACPAGQVCIDDPSDSCDPDHGGADCGGICRDEVFCSGATAKCAAGYKWSTSKCSCVPTDCRDTGCAAGAACQMCWGNYACVPDGAVC